MQKLPWNPDPDAPIAIAPSILSADFGNLAGDIRSVEKASADFIHVDVMDGHFVPNITIGPLVVRAARHAANVPIDVHLMIEHPDQFLEDFAKAGADVLTVHAEACTHLQRTLRRIRDLGMAAGVALNPHTPEEVLRYVLEDVDLVLVMTVNPGFGGQAFLSSMLPKIESTRSMVDRAGFPILIEVDGGISPSTAAAVGRAGARVLVAGSAVFANGDHAKAIAGIRGEAISGMRSAHQ